MFIDQNVSTIALKVVGDEKEPQCFGGITGPL
jgi:hypothetical protein